MKCCRLACTDRTGPLAPVFAGREIQVFASSPPRPADRQRRGGRCPLHRLAQTWLARDQDWTSNKFGFSPIHFFSRIFSRLKLPVMRCCQKINILKRESCWAGHPVLQNTGRLQFKLPGWGGVGWKWGGKRGEWDCNITDRCLTC